MTKENRVDPSGQLFWRSTQVRMTVIPWVSSSAIAVRTHEEIEEGSELDSAWGDHFFLPGRWRSIGSRPRRRFASSQRIASRSAFSVFESFVHSATGCGIVWSLIP